MFDKFVMTKDGFYVGKGYLADDLFKIKVLTVIPKMNTKNESSTYLIEYSYIWHGRLEHVNFDFIHKLVNMDCLPKFNIKNAHKYECVWMPN